MPQAIYPQYPCKGGGGEGVLPSSKGEASCGHKVLPPPPHPPPPRIGGGGGKGRAVSPGPGLRVRGAARPRCRKTTFSRQIYWQLSPGGHNVNHGGGRIYAP